MRDFVDVTVVENGQPWVGGGKPVKGVVNGDRISIPTRDIRAMSKDGWNSSLQKHTHTRLILSRGRVLVVDGSPEAVKRACAEESETATDELFEALAQVCTRVEELERVCDRILSSGGGGGGGAPAIEDPTPSTPSPTTTPSTDQETPADA